MDMFIAWCQVATYLSRFCRMCEVWFVTYQNYLGLPTQVIPPTPVSVKIDQYQCCKMILRHLRDHKELSGILPPKIPLPSWKMPRAIRMYSEFLSTLRKVLFTYRKVPSTPSVPCPGTPLLYRVQAPPMSPDWFPTLTARYLR